MKAIIPIPLLIPLAVIEVVLTVATLVHVFTHKKYRFGNRAVWVILSFVTILGPVIYFTIGRDDE